MMNEAYNKYQEIKEKEQERLCKKCGACCGIFDKDPCIHLSRIKDKEYVCGIYEERLGLRKSISGREFFCVPIRNILHKSWNGSLNCAYKKVLRNSYV